MVPFGELRPGELFHEDPADCNGQWAAIYMKTKRGLTAVRLGWLNTAHDQSMDGGLIKFPANRNMILLRGSLRVRECV